MELFHYWVMSASAVTVLFAMLSLLVAFKVMRVNTSHSTSIIYASSCYSDSIDGGQSIRLEVRVKNLGLPIQKPRLALVFNAPDGWGTFSSEFSHVNRDGKKQSDPISVFERGDIATFMLFYNIDDANKHANIHQRFWGKFVSATKHRAHIVIEQNGVVISKASPKKTDLFRKKWNLLVYKFERLTEREVTTPYGTPGIVYPFALPRFEAILSSAINAYACMVKDRLVQPSSDNSAPSEEQSMVGSAHLPGGK